jgi:hypothetical protein
MSLLGIFGAVSISQTGEFVMAEIVSFPGSVLPRFVPGNPAPPLAAAVLEQPLSLLPATGGRRGEYALGDVARELKLSHLSIRTIIDHLRILARHDGMPLPTTPRAVGQRPVHGPASIWKKSRWDAGRFDAWLDDRGGDPSTPAPALPQPVREEMKRRAGGML